MLFQDNKGDITKYQPVLQRQVSVGLSISKLHQAHRERALGSEVKKKSEQKRG